MAIDPGEFKSIVGLDSLYYALITADSDAAYTAGTPKPLAPAAEASLEPNTSTETQYADNQPYDTSVSEGETKITLTVTGVPLSTLAEITGCVFDAVNGLMYDNGGNPPDCALLFRSLKSNGSNRYFAYLKGKFDKPKEAAKTKAASTEYQPQELTYTAIKTIHKFALTELVADSVKRLVGDEDITAFDGADWFEAVTTPPEVSGSV